MELLHEVITEVTENCDLQVLPVLWNLTLVFSKDDVVLRRRIKKKIPDTTRLYGLRAAPTSSFPFERKADLLEAITK